MHLKIMWLIDKSRATIFQARFYLCQYSLAVGFIEVSFAFASTLTFPSLKKKI